GVSPSAVSRYLTGGSLSPAKYEAIDKVIKETGYVPNLVAHNLRTGRVRQVGILVPKIHSQSVSMLVEGAHEMLSQAGYMTVLGSLEHQPDSVGRYLDWMEAYHMAGAIVMAANDAEVRNGTFAKCTIPLVITGQHFKDFNCVYHDDWGAAKALTELLLQRGRQRICCISGPKTDPAVGVNRIEGVKAALWEAGRTPAPPTVVSAFNMEGGREAMRRLLADHPDLDGVFCATDSMAQGALMALREAGKRVPEDVSVVAFGNDWANQVSSPQLTTAELYQTQCGRDAANILLELLEKGSDADVSRQIKLGYRIVERGSV
ncbi:MAG: LacI family DNA-binding transcriptional regulator, partial [Clostridia bacterium]|nr:LacI family DNA-binding transcriptional regulator [Clostridia bacterium]